MKLARMMPGLQESDHNLYVRIRHSRAPQDFVYIDPRERVQAQFSNRYSSICSLLRVGSTKRSHK